MPLTEDEKDLLVTGIWFNLGLIALVGLGVAILAVIRHVCG